MKFSEKTEEIMNEGMLKINTMQPKSYDRADGLVTIKAVNNIAAGIRQLFEDLYEEDYEKDEVKTYIYTLLQKIFKDQKEQQ